MPIITPVTPWVNGPVTVAMMNAKINDRIAELQKGTARGILGTWTTLVQTDAPNTTFVPVSNWQQTVTVDSPRTVQLVMSCTLNASAPGLIPDVICYVNGAISARVSQALPAAGGAGQMIPNAAGNSIAVPAGTVSITAQLRCKFGSGTVSIFTGGILQLIDQGAS